MENNLLPCPVPWCESATDPPFAYSQPHDNGESWQINCPECGCDGPIGDTESEARELWNRRPERPVASRVIASAGHTFIAEFADWVVDHYKIGIGYEIGGGRLGVAKELIYREFMRRFLSEAKPSTPETAQPEYEYGVEWQYTTDYAPMKRDLAPNGTTVEIFPENIIDAFMPTFEPSPVCSAIRKVCRIKGIAPGPWVDAVSGTEGK